jgi:hypothetical protein
MGQDPNTGKTFFCYEEILDKAKEIDTGKSYPPLPALTTITYSLMLSLKTVALLVDPSSNTISMPTRPNL